MKRLVVRVVVGAGLLVGIGGAAYGVYVVCGRWPWVVPWLELGGLCLLLGAAELVLLGAALAAVGEAMEGSGDEVQGLCEIPDGDRDAHDAGEREDDGGLRVELQPGQLEA